MTSVGRKCALANVDMTARREPEVLDIRDVTGSRVIETAYLKRIGVREDNAAAALEIMSRFAIDPRWLLYLPPTMSPVATSSQTDLLEHPEQAFDAYRAAGVSAVVCEEKHMGSRAVLLVCRSVAAAQSRFGIADEAGGALWTRTGRPFFGTELTAAARGPGRHIPHKSAGTSACSPTLRRPRIRTIRISSWRHWSARSRWPAPSTTPRCPTKSSKESPERCTVTLRVSAPHPQARPEWSPSPSRQDARRRVDRHRRARWQCHMLRAMTVEVTAKTIAPTPTAVVVAATTWADFPTVWRPMLDEVWGFLRGGAPEGLYQHGHNIMLYRDDVPNVEVGVQVTGSFAPAGHVVASTLPGGLVATATHTGPIASIGDTHQAVRAWSEANGYRLAGPRWEIYGDPDPSTGGFEVDVVWSLAVR
jgi:effector-binding domain-containing protein